MKDLLAKIKGLDYRQLALQHAEKAVLGLVALITLACVATTSWSGYARTPEELLAAARKADSQLEASQMPPETLQELAVVDFPRVADQQLAQLNLGLFEYRTAMSFPISQTREPNEDPAWLPVEDLIATTDTFVMSTLPPQEEFFDPLAADGVPMGDDDDPDTVRRDKTAGGQPGAGVGIGPLPAAPGPQATPASPGGGRRGRNPAANQLPGSPADAAMPGGPMDMSTTTAFAHGRGVRFAVVRGVVPYRAQIEKIAQALHLDVTSQAMDYLEFLDFQVERQAAISGPDPWAGPWEKLDVLQSVSVLLNEASDFDPEIVSPDVTNVVFTSPLPQRVNGYWADQVTHPRLKAYELDEEQRLEELEKNMQALNEFQELGGELPQPKLGGFAGAQINMGFVRTTVGARPTAPGQPPMRGMPGAMMPGAPGMGPMAGPGGARGSLGLAGPAKMMLFRYFDFSVDPGACYRYRVRLVVRNPNYGLPLQQVRRPEVADGAERYTDWSLPSPPVAVKTDIDYFLARVPRLRNVAKPEVEMDVYQWDPTVGTIINANLKMALGQLVGGKTKTRRLNVAVPSFDEEDVQFQSRHALVDNLSAPSMIISSPDHAELGVDSRQWSKLVDGGAFDRAIVMNQYGELKTLDAATLEKQRRDIKRELERQNKPYQDLLEQEKSTDPNVNRLGDPLAPPPDPAMMNAGDGRSRRRNPAKLRPGAAAMPGMPN